MILSVYDLTTQIDYQLDYISDILKQCKRSISETKVCDVDILKIKRQLISLKRATNKTIGLINEGSTKCKSTARNT